MKTEPLVRPDLPAHKTTSKLPLIFAFLIIYVVWGSTFLAIRVAVATVPPLLAAGIRFLVAGAVLLVYVELRGLAMPSRLEWRNLTISAALMFLASYSGLFWAEKTIPSGVASVLVATIPVWTALCEIALKRDRFRWALAAALLLGLGGVGILALGRGASRISLFPCLAILGAEIAWSAGSVFCKVAKLPESKPLTAGAQMFAGGIMLLACSALAGEMSPWPHVSMRAAGAILYLIVAGSLVAFTAYIWLLDQLPATTVASYAYVNPIIALMIGHWLGQEVLNSRILFGSGLVLASVVLILKSKPKPQR